MIINGIAGDFRDREIVGMFLSLSHPGAILIKMSCGHARHATDDEKISPINRVLGATCRCYRCYEKLNSFAYGAAAGAVIASRVQSCASLDAAKVYIKTQMKQAAVPEELSPNLFKEGMFVGFIRVVDFPGKIAGHKGPIAKEE